MKNIIVIVGPTGVGKTKLSIELAKRLDAEIINGDSVSIYKDLNIGSAKPSIEERSSIPHHLMDFIDVECDYSVFDYQRDCRKFIQDISSRGKRVIIVGGTGLYIKAALYDYRFTEGTSNNSYDNLSNEEILEKIKAYSVSNLVDVGNRKRLVRLLNKLENNEEITNYKDNLLYPIKVIGLDNMLDNGLLKEVESLKDKYSSCRILNSGIGYKEFYDYFYHSKKIDDVVEEIKKDSRRFAKRQYTFFNHQFNTKWFDVDFLNFNHTIDQVYHYIMENENEV